MTASRMAQPLTMWRANGDCCDRRVLGARNSRKVGGQGPQSRRTGWPGAGVGVVPRSIVKFVPSFIVQIHRVTPYKMICKRNPVTTTKHQ